MPYQTIQVLLTPDTSIATVCLNRPERCNALNATMMDELTMCFQQELCDPSIRLIILKGNGAHFCSGADITWMKNAQLLSFEQNLADTLQLTRLLEIMHFFPKPLLTLAQGSIRGAGLGLLSVSDIVIAHHQTCFSLTETGLGLVPACIAPFLTAKIGLSTMRFFSLTGRLFSPEKAFQIGLVHHISPTATDQEQALKQYTHDILSCAPQATMETKKLLLRLPLFSQLFAEECLNDASLTLAQARITDEAKEGIDAFLEKRPPQWKG